MLNLIKIYFWSVIAFHPSLEPFCEASRGVNPNKLYMYMGLGLKNTNLALNFMWGIARWKYDIEKWLTFFNKISVFDQPCNVFRLAPTTKIKLFLDSLKKELSKNVYFYYGKVYTFQAVSP